MNFKNSIDFEHLVHVSATKLIFVNIKETVQFLLKILNTA